MGVWGRFYSGVYGREMSQVWDEGDGDKVSIDKELMEVGRVAEGDRGGTRKNVASGGNR